MAPSHLMSARIRPARRPAQRGIVMIFTLIALTLLLVAAAAVLRTVDSSSILVNNLAFRRDFTNRAESGFASAKALFTGAGALSTEAARQADSQTNHYSSSRLPNASNGMPTVLVNDTNYASTYGTPTTSGGITVRWVIDRQCLATGAYSSSSCEYYANSGDSGGTGWLRKPGGGTQAVYRISVRITGPRNAEAFYQSTYAD